MIEDNFINPMTPKIYLETTLFNYYFLVDPDRESDKEATIMLFKEIKEGKFEAYVSSIVIDELEKCIDDEKRKSMLGLINEYQIKKLSEESFRGYKRLAQEYIKTGAIPEKKRDDAAHIAITTLANMDILVSWNCAHIVKFRTQEIVRVINGLRGYSEISINTPKEVITYD